MFHYVFVVSRLYDPAQPAGATLVKKYTDWNNKYRTILHADIIHLRRADGNGIDAILHVEPDTSKSTQRAMLVVFNQQVCVILATLIGCAFGDVPDCACNVFENLKMLCFPSLLPSDA